MQTPATGEFLLRLRELRDTIEGMESDPACPFVLSTIHASTGHTFIDQLLGEEPPEPAPEPRFNPQPKPKRAKAKRPAYTDGPTPAQLAKQQEDFMAGSEVVHKEFGKGEILGRLGSIALIAFEDIDETKRIDLTTCLKKGLIRLAGQ